eukprot:758875-Hanusia_phi.AAC.1
MTSLRAFSRPRPRPRPLLRPCPCPCPCPRPLLRPRPRYISAAPEARRARRRFFPRPLARDRMTVSLARVRPARFPTLRRGVGVRERTVILGVGYMGGAREVLTRPFACDRLLPPAGGQETPKSKESAGAARVKEG